MVAFTSHKWWGLVNWWLCDFVWPLKIPFMFMLMLLLCPTARRPPAHPSQHPTPNNTLHQSKHQPTSGTVTKFHIFCRHESTTQRTLKLWIIIISWVWKLILLPSKRGWLGHSIFTTSSSSWNGWGSSSWQVYKAQVAKHLLPNGRLRLGTFLDLTWYASPIFRQDSKIWYCHLTGLCPEGMPNEGMWRQMAVSATWNFHVIFAVPHAILTSSIYTPSFSNEIVIFIPIRSAKLHGTGPNCGIELANSGRCYIKLLPIGCTNSQGTTCWVVVPYLWRIAAE